MEYICPHCGRRIKDVQKECLVDLTEIIADRIKSKADMADKEDLGYQIRLRERFKNTRRFYIKAGKKNIRVSFTGQDIKDELENLKNKRKFDKLEVLINDAKRNIDVDDFRFELQAEDSYKNSAGESCFDSYVVLNRAGQIRTAERVYRCCPFCQAKVADLAGHFTNKTIVIMGDSLLNRISFLNRIKVVCAQQYPNQWCENNYDESDELFPYGSFLLCANSKYLLLNVIETDARVFELKNNDIPGNDRKRFELFLKNADYVWIPLKKDNEGFKRIKEAICGRENWLSKKKCIVCCLSDDEIKQNNNGDEVLKLYRESWRAKKWISDNDANSDVLTNLENVFNTTFYYFGKELSPYPKTSMALEWVMFLEGIRDADGVYIGKNKGLLKNLFSKDSENEYKLYTNLTQQEGFII